MEGDSGEQVGAERVWHHQQGVLCKADGMRQDVNSRDEVMYSEMSDWWILEKKMYVVERWWKQMRSEYHEGLNSDQAVQISRLSSDKSFVGKIE